MARALYILVRRRWRKDGMQALVRETFRITRCDVGGLRAAFLQEWGEARGEGRGKLSLDALARLAPQIAACLEQVAPEIEKIYGTFFRVNLVSASRTRPAAMEPGSSFDFHYDNVPWCSLKVFFYLNDQQADTGAFRALDADTTASLIQRGFDSSSVERRTRSQALVTPDIRSRLRVAEGTEGTVLIWHNRLVHKATLPERGHRDLVQLEIMPALWPSDFRRLLRRPRQENTTWELIGRGL